MSDCTATSLAESILSVHAMVRRNEPHAPGYTLCVGCEWTRSIDSLQQARQEHAAHILEVIASNSIALVNLPDTDDAEIDLVLEAVEEGLRQIGAVVCVAEDDDDPGTPGILTPPDGDAACLYDLNNEISSAFLALARQKPSHARDLAAELLAVAETAEAPR
ncbi:hypothetical protein [Mycolicibacterium nivoides]|uniref:Uncharacterized protein n=2 Tax=Mycolicibacterium nivoides TaxID=2487344 RepID=A0ABW9LLX1_9MYCO